VKKEEKSSESGGGGAELPTDLSEENVFNKLEKAKGETRAKLLSWIDGKAKGVLESKAFLKISKATLVELFKRDSLGVAEVDVWEAAIRWSTANATKSKDKVEEKKNFYPISYHIFDSLFSALKN